MMKPLQYPIYKGMTGKFGAIQFNLQRPHYYKGKEKDFTGEKAIGADGKLVGDWKLREGAVFLEITSASGPNQYDWEKKITFALSVQDMGKMLTFLQTGRKLALMHDPGAKTDAQGAVKKHLNMDSPNGILAEERGGCMLRLSQQSAQETVAHTVPLSSDECLVLKRLLESAIPAALAWS